MEINGLKLPQSLVHLVQDQAKRKRLILSELRRNRDAFGNELETEIADIYTSRGQFFAATDALSQHFYFEQRGYGDTDIDARSIGIGTDIDAGVLEDILDFTKVVCFGRSFDDAPFCLDFRENEAIPRVIWWFDAYWRVVAPDFDSFVALFDVR